MAFLSITSFIHVMLAETSLRPPWLSAGQWPCASRRNLLVQGVPHEFKVVAMDGLTIFLWYEYGGGVGVRLAGLGYGYAQRQTLHDNKKNPSCQNCMCCCFITVITLRFCFREPWILNWKSNIICHKRHEVSDYKAASKAWHGKSISLW